MKCNFRNRAIDKNQNYERGINDGVYSMMLIIAYVLSRYGYKGRKIEQIIHSIQDTAESINKGYCSKEDIAQCLLEEYDIIIRDQSRSENDEL